MAETIGRIILAQEGRFKLVTAEGQTKLFILAHDAPQEPQELVSLVGAQEVAVEFSSVPRKIADLAHRIARVSR
jgi:hypothetical protein